MYKAKNKKLKHGKHSGQFGRVWDGSGIQILTIVFKAILRILKDIPSRTLLNIPEH